MHSLQGAASRRHPCREEQKRIASGEAIWYLDTSASHRVDMKTYMQAMLARAKFGFDAEFWKFIKFVFFAGLSIPANVISRILLSFYFRFEIAIILSHFIGMAVAFALLKNFVFTRSGGVLSQEFGRFIVVNAFSLCQTWVVSVFLKAILFPALHMKGAYLELLAHVLGLSTTAVTSFIAHSRLTFAKRGGRDQR